MQEFTNFITEFLINIYESISSSLSGYSDVAQFFEKNVFLDNSLIGLNLTYNELFFSLGSFLLVGLFIYAVIKIIFKLIGMIRI